MKSVGKYGTKNEGLCSEINNEARGIFQTIFYLKLPPTLQICITLLPIGYLGFLHCFLGIFVV